MRPTPWTLVLVCNHTITNIPRYDVVTPNGVTPVRTGSFLPSRLHPLSPDTAYPSVTFGDLT